MKVRWSRNTVQEAGGGKVTATRLRSPSEAKDCLNAYQNTSKDPSVELWITRSGLFQFGYAECYFNDDYNAKLKANFFDISSAVDASGQPIQLKAIKFIKVQSSVFQIASWLNEISTEISGAADIHLLDKNSY